MSDTKPALSEIAEKQNDETSLRYQLAKAYFYTRAKWLYVLGTALTVALALAAPLVLLFAPGAGPKLGAIAGLWIFVARLALEPLRNRFQLRGAIAQECFDCRVLSLPWNEALARRLPDEEISAARRVASRSERRVRQARDWYAADVELTWPRSVLICQRSNAVWACRQHRAYGWVVVVAAVAWAVIGVVVAVADSASLGVYLVTIALPSLPAFLDASDLFRAHSAASRARELLRDQGDALVEEGNADVHDLREIQDQLFHLRRDAPQVPEWFYNVVRPSYEEDMKYAVEQTAERFEGTSK